MTVDYKAIGSRIKMKRQENRLTQEQMAELLDVTVGYVSQAERGITKPNLEMLANVSRILKCDMSFFVCGVCVDTDTYLNSEISEKVKSLSDENKRLIKVIIDSMLELQSGKTK